MHEEIEEMNPLTDTTTDIPFLVEWEPGPEQCFMEFKGDYVQAHYERLGLRENNKLGLYVVKKGHYKDRMPDICKVINYFLTYFDTEQELFRTMMSVKFIVDQRPNMTLKGLKNTIVDSIVTDHFVACVKNMTNHLYSLNIDSDVEGRYKSTPKINNAQAKIIVGISFAIRCILPICIHASDTNNNFVNKKDYIPCFDKIFMKVVKRFEKNDIHVFTAIEKFVKYRVERYWKSDIGICIKKKQIYGMTLALYQEEVIHEVILVKTLYKLDYNKSVVSFIDGVIFSYHYNFKIENFKCKPVEIDAQENQDDDGERLSHAEALEMMVYRIDESNALINEVNLNKVLQYIRTHFNITISQEEYDFYRKHISLNPVTEYFLKKFYNRYFHDSNAILNIDEKVTIELIIYMKKYLQMIGLVLIPQLCTAQTYGRLKINTIKNSKFNEKIRTSNIWNDIIQKKFTYLSQVNPKDDLTIKEFSIFINSKFVFVDFNGPDDGLEYEIMDQDLLIYEFSLFLSIT